MIHDAYALLASCPLLIIVSDFFLLKDAILFDLDQFKMLK